MACSSFDAISLVDQNFIAESFDGEVAVYFRALGDTHLLDQRAFDLICLIRQSSTELALLFPEGIEILEQYLQALTNIGIIQHN